ncbi:MAG: salicylaldehyde dehydrogenase, partial [Xanthobacteraceae bacterium]
MLRVNLMIGDRDVSATDGRTFERIDPLTGLVATEAGGAALAPPGAAAPAAARAGGARAPRRPPPR